jgi:hypothetical protein
MPLDVTITNEEKVQISLNPVTATGKPAKVDGVPVWSVQFGTVTLDVAADGLSAFIVSGDNPEDADVLVDADADLGPGVADISDVVHMHVTSANAANLGLIASPPVPK